MKKTLIASAIALTSIAATNASANSTLTLTGMVFDGLVIDGVGVPYIAEGTITDGGAPFGSMNSAPSSPFYGVPWTAVQVTDVMTSGTWSDADNASGSGPFSYDLDAILVGSEVGVGLFFDWNTNTEIAVLGIFDCVTTPGSCSGRAVPMANGPFAGQGVFFSGTGGISAVPVPAAVWLMGSGLLGLVGVARRRKVA